MAQRIHQVKTMTDNGATTETTKTDANDRIAPQAEVQPASYTAARVVWFIAGVIITLLAFRLILILLGANQNNGFVNFIYSVSRPFAAPFFGMFGYTVKYGVSRFEVSTLVAIAIYALIAWGISKLITIRQPRQY